MGFFKQTIRDVPIEHKTVLVRADYNVPLSSDGTISDDLRIRASLPTLRYLLRHGCKVVIISHLGRPEGRDAALSLEPVGERLAKLLGQSVHFVNDCIGDRVHQAVKKAPTNSVILLENLRFYKEEEANSHSFAKRITHDTGARYFVQDGFGVVHRAHASTQAITLCLPSVAGLLLEKEVTSITAALENPKRPLVTIMGGAKVSDKIGVIERFIANADHILIGGAMANTILGYKGISMGASKVEDGQSETLDHLYEKANEKTGGNADEFIILPQDVAVATSMQPDAERQVVDVRSVHATELALDIGDQTIEQFSNVIREAGTVIWNGPVGYSEIPAFAVGSAAVATAITADATRTSIIGGGDTADFALKWDTKHGDSFTHVSTGGGAALELMAGEKLPGVESLLDAHR